MEKESLLLHCCCAPCSIHVIDLLKDKFVLTLYFYNPNIYPEAEYILRKKTLQEYARKIKLPYLDEDYKPLEFYSQIKGLEQEKEGGKRCSVCFQLRLLKTVLKAKNMNIKHFSTTLTISPYKNSRVIMQIAAEISSQNDLIFLEQDFKKKDGFKWTLQKSRAQNFYIQNYCGCEYSLKKKSI